MCSITSGYSVQCERVLSADLPANQHRETAYQLTNQAKASNPSPHLDSHPGNPLAATQDVSSGHPPPLPQETTRHTQTTNYFV